MKKASVLCALLSGACGLAISSAAMAQDAAVAEEESDAIIVTAQNRAQDVTDVPIAIDVISGEELQNAGFADMNDIDEIAPAVQLNQDQGTIKITVRGVGTNSNDEAQDTSVVVNVDGEYINRPNALGVALFDMDRVEVLRGPQGTLYGRNSTGGAINFITRKPGNDFGVNASASYGNYEAIRLDAGVDLPLGDIAGVRVSGFYDEHDGYVKHPAGGGFGPFPAFAAGRSDDNEAYGGRVSLRLNPTDALTINLAGEYAERHFRPGIFAAVDLNGAGTGPTGPGCNASGFTRVGTTFPETVVVAGVPTVFQRTLCVPSSTNLLSRIDRSEFAAPNFGLGTNINQETYALRGRIAYEISDAATITYIGGYRDFSQGNTDGSEFRTLPIVYRSVTFVDEAQTQSHELRVNGEIGGVIYQVGGFYFKEELQRESGFALPIGANGTFLSYFGRDISSESKSAFGQIEVPLGDTLTAVGGLRYTDNSRKAVYRNAGPFFNPNADIFRGMTPPPGGPPDAALFNAGVGRKNFADLRYLQTLNLASDENKVTWLAGLNYKPNADTLIYAKASTGFKGGGFDAVGVFAPETNTAFEGGWKQTFGPDRQHQFNLAGFYYDYKDLQVSVLLDTTVGGQVFNAGAATIWGAEVSADIELDENNLFHATFNYLNAEYDELLAQFNVFCLNDSPPTACGINGVGDNDPNTPGIQQPNFAGNRPPFSPEFIVTVGYDHIFRLGSAGKLTASANTTFKSSYFTDFFNYRDGRQKALTQTDLSLEYKPENERFTVIAFVKNLENTRPLTYGSFVSAGPDDIYNWQFGTPRTYGLRVSVDF